MGCGHVYDCMYIHVSEDDWEASHFAVVGGEGSSLPTEPLHRSDAIQKAMPAVIANHSPRPPAEEVST